MSGQSPDTATRAPAVLTCDMRHDCAAPVTHVDEKGWLYCATHGPDRRAGGIRCRQLRPHEIARLENRQTIRY